jgi:hypothetical protein
LTFDDSIIYGCYLDLNFLELEQFCNDKAYKQLSIFQNLREFSHVGKYGNSSILHKTEWSEVQQPTENNNAQATFEGSDCTFPSTTHLRFFYEKIGKESDPHNVIIASDLSVSRNK